jgi:tetratricopeptide (TPR) repeat protein
MDSKQVLARFEAERQALALMDHPNIARVLDAGATTNGRPYFVMELVKGVPITKYCDEHRLTPTQRLELFVPVCQAIQHAHHKGIIHRDIKPSNILIALYDGKPVPKVIDFGVAKAAGQQLTDKTLMTGFGSVVGTLEYMSPEQAELNQLDIDTRSDIYSLGVVLYELLTGSTPLDKKRLKQAAFGELLRIIREEEPQKPSTRLSHSTDSLPSVSAQRQMEPAKLTKLVRGELDWIVMKALEKDRNRRYETANGFAMDVQRYLADEPVEACPPSAGYRFRKFARRNRAALGIAGLVFAAMLLTLAILVISNIRIEKEKRAKDEALGHAKFNANLADEESRLTREAVSEYFTLVSQSKLFNVPGLQPLRMQLLEAAVRYYQALMAKRSDDPTVRAELAVAYLRLAGVYFEVDRNNDSVAALSEGVVHAEELLRRFPDNPQLLRRLGGYWKGTRRMSGSGPMPDDLAAAERALTRFIQVWEKLAAQNPMEAGFQSDLAVIYDVASEILLKPSTYSKAIAFSEKAVALWEEVTRAYPNEPEYQAALGQTYRGHASRLARSGNPQDGSRWSEKARPIRERLAAQYPNVPQYQEDLAESLTSKARQLAGQGNSKEADANFGRALEIWRKLASAYPNAHLYPTQLGNVYGSLGKWDKAIAEYTTAIELKPDYLEALSKRAAAYNNVGQYDKAIADYRKTCELNPQEPYAAIAYAGLCLSLNMEDEYRRHRKTFLARFQGTSDPAVAERIARAFLLLPATGEELERAAALADLSVELGRHHGFYPYFMAVKALAEYRRARYESAIDWGQKSNAFGLWAALHLVQAMAYQELGHTEQARQLLAAALTSDEWNDPQWSWIAEPLLREAEKVLKLDEAAVHVDRGLVHTRRGKWPEAVAEYGKAIDLDPKNAVTRSNRANAYYALKQYDKAAADYTQAIDLDAKNAVLCNNRGNAYYALKQYDKAATDYTNTIKLDPKFAVAWSNRGGAYASLRQWEKALADFSRSIEINPQVPQVWYFRGLVRLQCGDREGYRKDCAGMRQQFGASAKPDVVNWIVWTCILLHNGADDWTKLVQWAQNALAADPDNEVRLTTLGAVLYRADRYDEAVRRLTEADAAFKKATARTSTIAYAWLFLAMAEERRSHAVQAREWHAKAVREIEQQPAERAGDFFWNRQLVLRLLRGEAETLLKIDKNPEKKEP